MSRHKKCFLHSHCFHFICKICHKLRFNLRFSFSRSTHMIHHAHHSAFCFFLSRSIFVDHILSCLDDVLTSENWIRASRIKPLFSVSQSQATDVTFVGQKSSTHSIQSQRPPIIATSAAARVSVTTLGGDKNKFTISAVVERRTTGDAPAVFHLILSRYCARLRRRCCSRSQIVHDEVACWCVSALAFPPVDVERTEERNAYFCAWLRCPPVRGIAG